MSAEQNKAIARRFFEEADRKVFDNVDEILAPNFVSHLPVSPAPLDAASFIQFTRAFAAGFPDYTHTIEDQVCEGDTVVTRITWRGTHTGDFQGIPATGKQPSMMGINFLRIEGGKIVEQWAQFDVMSLMQQLGAIPSPEPALV